MGRRNRIGLHFEGFDEVIQQFQELERDMKPVVEEALRESQKIVAEKARDAMAKHHRSGRTEESVKETGEVFWSGSEAEIGVGFEISSGGLPSVFLMYGTPRMKKDSKVYNAIYGKKTKEEIGMIQALIFHAAINERFGE